MGRPGLNTAAWVKQARDTHGDAYGYAEVEYVGYACKVRITCPVHGVFEQQENNHRNGNGCPKCGVAARAAARAHTFDSFVSAAKDRHGDKYEYPTQPMANSRSMVRLICPAHGDFSIRAYSHLNGQGCRACGYETNGKRSQIGLSEFLRRARAVHGDTYEYLSGLSGLHCNMRIACPIHGEFSQTPHNHLAGAGCPRCVGKISRGETEVADFIRSLGLEVVTSDRTVIAPFEVDVHVPSLRVGVEYNGVWFHRDDLVGNKTRRKWEAAAKAGITLVQIFEDEWRDKRQQVEARLRAILGCSDRSFARQCDVVTVAPRRASEFLGKWHTQGVGPSTVSAYGLERSGELLALATFGKGRFRNSGWELLRFCSIGRVAGAVSRLVAAFSRANPGVDVVSYADLRWGNGDGYKSAGFTFVGVTEPDYWWADSSGNRHSRYSMQKRPQGVTEREFAAQKKLFRVSGVGHKKWVWTSER